MFVLYWVAICVAGKFVAENFMHVENSPSNPFFMLNETDIRLCRDKTLSTPNDASQMLFPNFYLGSDKMTEFYAERPLFSLSEKKMTILHNFLTRTSASSSNA